VLPTFEEYCRLIASLPDQFLSISPSQAFSPSIKHHRIPAPELSFTRPNLPVLIEEVERLLEG